MDHFKNKIAVVTGGASGIGRALCEELCIRGAFVVAADINAAKVEQVVSSINENGGRAFAAHLDVSQAEEVRKLIDDTVSTHGRLDYLFNNAGIAVVGEVRDIGLEHWQRIIETNLLGVINGTLAAYPQMIKQGSGHIVNTASCAGLLPYPMGAPYAMTKFAVVGLSTSLRAEAAALGVKVSVVCPGFIQTGIYNAATILNIKRDDALALISVKLLGVRHSARLILRGVARHKAIIIFPLYARFLWWLYRLHPVLVNPFHHMMIKNLRAARKEPNDTDSSPACTLHDPRDEQAEERVSEAENQVRDGRL